MRFIAIDPGPTESAWLIWDNGPTEFDKCENCELIVRIKDHREQHLVIEMVASYGMIVGREVFETCVWIGRFLQAFADHGGGSHSFAFRKQIVTHLCGSARAKDSNVRQALIDRFGGKAKAIGNKKAPGLLHGMKKDTWSALAIACAHADVLRAVANGA